MADFKNLRWKYFGKELISEVEFEKAIEDLVVKFKKENFKATNEALEVAAKETQKRLEAATPIGDRGGVFKRGWGTKFYPNQKYIYNSEGSKGNRLGIPLTNLFVYSRNHANHRFVLETWEKNKGAIGDIFVKEYKKRLKKVKK